MSELQWNLLDTQMPAKVATAFNPLGSFNDGQMTGQKLQMNQLQMDKARQDMEYNPMKLYMKQQEIQSRVDKNTVQAQKTEVDTALKEHQLSMQFSLEASQAQPGQLLPTIFGNIDKMTAIMGKSPEEAAAKKQEYQKMVDTYGEDVIKKHLFDSSQGIKEKIGLMLGQRKLDQGQQSIDLRARQGDERLKQGWANVGIGQTNAATGQGNLAVNQQRLLQPNIGVMNTGQELIPYNKKGDVLQPVPLQFKPGQERMIEVAEQNADTNKSRSMSMTEIGATRPHVANLMANGWMPVGRITKPMLDAVEAAATEAEKQGLPFDPDAVRAYEFQGQKNTALGRTAGSRLVTARAQNITTAEKLLTRMQDTAKELDFSDIKIAAIADKWIKGQTQDPVLSRYMTQRADALFALGNALKQNGLTDKAIEIEEEAAHPTVSPRAFDAWYKVQMEALKDAGEEMKASYNPPMPNKQMATEVAPATGPVTIKSDADYNALPSGTVFTAPDGSVRRKP